MEKELTLTTLGEFDLGKADATFKALLQQAVKDCLSRPGDLSPREVVVTFKLSPEESPNADCEHVVTQVFVKSKLPAYRTAAFQCRPSHTGQLSFQALSPDDVEQHSLDELHGKDEQKT